MSRISVWTGGTSKRLFASCSRGSVSTWRMDSHLRRRLLGIQVWVYRPILSRNEKVEQHIRKKTHKLNTLKFWVEGGVIRLWELTLFLLCDIFSVFPLIFSQQIIIIIIIKIKIRSTLEPKAILLFWLCFHAFLFYKQHRLMHVLVRTVPRSWWFPFSFYYFYALKSY